ncbi:MAG: hypothetical protein WC812_03270 [Candidatus Pacearchaeota archaeon]|jgi:hypothetical protein
MTTKNYNIFLKEDLNLKQCYSEFFGNYRDYIKKIGDGFTTYDFKDTAIILFGNLTDIKQIRTKGVNNLHLIGTEDNIKKVVKSIKSKGFSLEEIN